MTGPQPPAEQVAAVEALGLTRYPDTNEWHLDAPDRNLRRVYVEWCPGRHVARRCRPEPQWCVSAPVLPHRDGAWLGLHRVAAEIEDADVLTAVIRAVLARTAPPEVTP